MLYRALSLLFYVLATFFALLLVWWGLRSRSSRRAESHTADAIDTVAGWTPQATRVLSTAEREAYDLVRVALPAHMVLAQVPLQRFIKVPTRNSYAEWLRRVGQLSVDLLVCDRHAQVIAVIEVQTAEDAANPRVQRRRDRVLKVLKSAQIPVHLWNAGQLPAVDEVRKAIAPGMVVDEAAAVAPIPAFPGRFATSGPAMSGVQVQEDEMPLREPPPSTWFDDLETSPAPLAPSSGSDAPAQKDRSSR